MIAAILMIVAYMAALLPQFSDRDVYSLEYRNDHNITVENEAGIKLPFMRTNTHLYWQSFNENGVVKWPSDESTTIQNSSFVLGNGGYYSRNITYTASGFEASLTFLPDLDHKPGRISEGVLMYVPGQYVIHYLADSDGNVEVHYTPSSTFSVGAYTSQPEILNNIYTFSNAAGTGLITHFDLGFTPEELEAHEVNVTYLIKYTDINNIVRTFVGNLEQTIPASVLTAGRFYEYPVSFSTPSLDVPYTSNNEYVLTILTATANDNPVDRLVYQTASIRRPLLPADVSVATSLATPALGCYVHVLLEETGITATNTCTNTTSTAPIQAFPLTDGESYQVQFGGGNPGVYRNLEFSNFTLDNPTQPYMLPSGMHIGNFANTQLGRIEPLLKDTYSLEPPPTEVPEDQEVGGNFRDPDDAMSPEVENIITDISNEALPETVLKSLISIMVVGFVAFGSYKLSTTAAPSAIAILGACLLMYAIGFTGWWIFLTMIPSLGGIAFIRRHDV